MTSPFPPARIAQTRFRSRHVQKTVAEFVEEKLNELGWFTPPINFNTAPITFKEIAPDENGIVVAANTVSVTAGDSSETLESQLGGGLYEIVIPIFVDVYGEKASIALSIAEDVKEQLSYGRVLPLLDWSDVQGPVVVDGAYIELENAVGPERPQASQVSQDFRRHWRVVKVEAHVFYGSA